MSTRIKFPCTVGISGRHRWRWRETHYRTQDGSPVMDRWCERCGNWYIDVIEVVR